MNWNRCRQHQAIGLLAAGALGDEDAASLEKHLAACPRCQTYYAEMKGLTTSLAEWEKGVSRIEPTQRARLRWANAIHDSTPEPVLRKLWRELIWPCRHAWSGMAALWIGMLVVNERLSDHPGGAFSASTQNLMQAWQEQNRVLAELTQPAFAAPAVVTPIPPRPRSAREQTWEII